MPDEKTPTSPAPTERGGMLTVGMLEEPGQQRFVTLTFPDGVVVGMSSTSAWGIGLALMEHAIRAAERDRAANIVAPAAPKILV